MGKHRFIKTHRSHKTLLAIIYIIVFLIGILLGKSIMNSSSLDKSSFTIYLLVTINLVLIVLVLLISSFIIDLKDNVLEVEEAITSENKKLNEELNLVKGKK